MKGFLRWVSRIAETQFFVGVSAWSFVQITGWRMGVEPHWALGISVLLGTMAGYAFIRQASPGESGFGKVFSGKFLWRSALGLVCLLLALLLFPTWNIRILLTLIAVAFLVLLYTIPFKGLPSNLRNWKYIKIYLVGLVWALVSVTLVWAETGTNWSLSWGVLFVQRWLLVLVLTIPFEIRDLKTDAPSLQTLPQWLGIPGAKRLGWVLLGCSLLLELGLWYLGIRELQMLHLFWIPVFGWVMQRSKVSDPWWYTSVFAELIPFFWYLSVTFLHGPFPGVF